MTSLPLGHVMENVGQFELGLIRLVRCFGRPINILLLLLPLLQICMGMCPSLSPLIFCYESVNKLELMCW